MKPLAIAVVIALAALLAAPAPGGWESNNWSSQHWGAPKHRTYIHPQTYGDVRDYSRRSRVIEIDRYGNGTGYWTVPGTDIQDYNLPSYRIEQR